MVIGPLGGGLLVDNASWRWIFAINVPFVLATLALVRAAVPESIDEQSAHRIDYLGAVLVALWLAGPVFALIEQPSYGFRDPVVYVPGLAGAVLLVAFVLHERRSDHPMLPLELFGARATSRSAISPPCWSTADWARRRSSSRSTCSRWRATRRSRRA